MQPQISHQVRKLGRLVGAIILLVLTALLGKQQTSSRPPAGGGQAGGVIQGSVRLVDGDSFFLSGREVRLKGIDAPEGRQSCTRDGRPWSCGDAAREELRRLINSQTVACDVIDIDQHQRVLAVCRAGGRNLNRDMVASGLAVSYGDFVKEEMAAKIARRGLWGSEFEQPRAWRRRNGVGI